VTLGREQHPESSAKGTGLVRRLEVPNALDPVPVIDGLVETTALVHDWTLVTCNVDNVLITVSTDEDDPALFVLSTGAAHDSGRFRT
jgi:hypothetical protein